jgi:NADP-dependent 3-hydroxy acid dehydrogenase YdfG
VLGLPGLLGLTGVGAVCPPQSNTTDSGTLPAMAADTSPPPSGTGRTAVVTGASSGIGAATARRLAADGWQVVAAARRLDRLTALADEVPGVRPVVLDVTDPASTAALAEAVPRCDLLVANAGGAFDLATLAEADAETWARTYDVNVLGIVRTVQALLPALAAARGHVVLTGSTAGRWVYEGGGGYVAAKHAVAALRETLRLEAVGSGVRVSEVAPGMVATEEFSVQRFGGDAERAAAVYAGVDALTADDVADAITWVASRPAHVNIDLVQLTPQQQAGVGKVVRRPAP